MSRSIHATRQKFARLWRADFADRDEKARLLKEMRAQLRRKRRIKDFIQEERTRIEPPLAGTSPEAIPIVDTDSSALVHYPLGPEDLRSLLYALPAAATDGLAEISLCLGKEYMVEATRGEKWREED